LKTFDFQIGDLLVSEQGTVALVHHITKNMNGNNAIYLMVTKRENVPLDTLPYAIVDVKLTVDIDAGRYKYYPIKV
jgi:hypothetical protein